MRLRSAIVLYNVVLVALGLVALPLWLLWVVRSPRLRRGFAERLRPLPHASSPQVWLHAASVGEAEAAVPLIVALRARGVGLVVTTLSDTGRERMRAHFPELEVRLAPLDLPWLVRASVRRARVTALVLLETELWPNTIAAVKRAQGAVIVASARISDRSLPRYRALRFGLALLLRELDAVAARSAADRQRFVSLGARPDRVKVVGDVKGARAAPPEASAALRAALGAGPFLLGASTHPGEERALLDAYEQLRRVVTPLRLVLVPRYPERAAEVVAVVESRGLAVGRRSAGAPDRPVVVVDTLGELASLYGLAELVFCGGTLAPVGGHNLFEAVAGGRVAVVGPHTHNQQAQVELLEPYGALIRIQEAQELPQVLERLWKIPDRHLPARCAQKLVSGQSGPVDQIVGWMEALGALPDVRT